MPDVVDTGHEALQLDIAVLLNDVKQFQFHDFKNTKYAAPKMALVSRLNELISNVKNGKYDN